MRITTLLLSIILLFFCNTVAGQNKRLEKAKNYFNSGEYVKARELYIKAFGKAKDKSSKGEISFYIAECSRKINDPRNAERWYRKAISVKYQNPLATLYLADMLKMRENYEEAMANYSTYKDMVPNDPRGQTGLESCQNATLWIEKPTRYVVYQARYLNDKESDFGVAFGIDSTDLYFTSAREGATGDIINDNSGMFFTDIFYATRDKKGKWSIPVPVAGAVNTAFDEGSPYITASGKTMYYTSCKYVKSQNLGCQIFKAQLQEDTWQQPELVTIFADSSISVGHPCLSPDELTLYFVAEHPDLGIGGKDIWKMERSSLSGSWGKPVNMGDTINTQADDLYPFVRQDGVLFFASNGHPGMGGLDIFMAKKEENIWQIDNMKFPINSSGDDFAISFFKNEKTGYLSSSRNGSRLDDIYQFYLPPIEVNIVGKVKNEQTGVVIVDARVKMTGTDGTQLETQTGADGSFRFNLKENNDYTFVSFKDRFLKGVGKETSRGLTENKTLEIEILMTPIQDKPIEIENIEYDFGKANLREESKISLDGLVELLEINSNITIELRSNTDFRGSDADNLSLSEKRAQAVVDYLISKGIKADRLVAKGLGESTPVTVSAKQAEKYPFLKAGDVLNETFINSLATNQEKEIAHQLNRRTEFVILSTDYMDTGIPFGND